MRYLLNNFRGKGTPYDRALQQAGHKRSNNAPDFLLTDRPERHPSNSKTRKIANFVQHGVPLFMYPHSPLPHWQYDGIVKCPKFVRCIFVFGEGQKEAAKYFIPDVPIEITGFPYFHIEKFKRIDQPKRILFAPDHHSTRSIPLRRDSIEANRRIQNDLLKLEGYDITCRYIGELKDIGLKPCKDWNWVKGRPDGSTKELEEADLVIARGTYMYLAIGKGVPTIGVNQHLVIRHNYNPAEEYPRHWYDYAHLFTYPINYDWVTPLPELIEQACDQEPVEWKRRCMGNELNPQKFTNTIKKYL